MARLRVRLELNRRSSGVPLDKLASVVEETRRFFHLLAEDVHMEADHGEWVASDFDPESLNFTAEYSGAVTPEQVHAFGAAFAGATSLRRATIAQFTRIADFLGEDELVGFGLFQSDTETEPSEWRCLSKRDAQRFGQEIRMLAEAVGESQPPTSLPAVMNGSVAGRRLFKDRREREALAADPAKMIREVEASLSRRIDLLEGQVESHDRTIKEARRIGTRAEDISDERFGRLLAAMEQFWAATPRSMPQLPAPELAVAPAVASEATVVAPEPQPDEAKPEPVAVAAEPAPKSTDTVAPEPTANPLPPEKSEVPEMPSPKEEPAPAAEALPLTVPEATKFNRWWVVGTMAVVLAALTFAIPAVQRQWSMFTTEQRLPLVQPKPPAAPALTVANAAQVTEAKTEPPSAPKPSAPEHVKTKHAEPFDGPQIALAIPADYRGRVPSEARVQVVVAIDDQGNVTRAEVASEKGRGARLLAKEALAAARRARFRPAREGDRAVESQMKLTYLFKPDSAEF